MDYNCRLVHVKQAILWKKGPNITWRVAVEDHMLQDTGQGLAPEDLPHRFERFYGVDKSRSRTVPGLGLGLSLVKRIVESCNGRVSIHSDGLCQGTAVHIHWPSPDPSLGPPASCRPKYCPHKFDSYNYAMRRDYRRWYSPALGRDMDLLIFGHSGARVLVFPTSKGKFYEWEDRGMMNAFGDLIERGWLQFYCVDSVDAESWYAYWKHPGARAWRQQQYDDYLRNEVLPLSSFLNWNPFLITAGASFGAYHALNFSLRHPGLVGRSIGLSGIYDISRWTDGHHNDTVYFHNPVSYIPHENDWGRLDALRRQDIILVTGKDDPLRDSTEELSGKLWDKGIGNALRIWEGWSHDWPFWQEMLRHYISGHD